jgi:hypothetical protein
MALKETPSCWWGSHKENINKWYQCKRLLRIRFGVDMENIYLEKYDGIGKPRENIERCMVQWILLPPEEWPHYFIHTLEGIPRNWYTELELRRGIANWEEMQKNFVITFAFEHENPLVDTKLKLVRDRIFEEPKFEIVTAYQNHNR